MHTNDSKAFPGEIEPLAPGDPNARSIAELLTAMSLAVSKGDTVAATRLIHEAEILYPADEALLASSVARCKSFVDRAGWLESILEAMRQDLDEDHFADALGHFRQALTLSRGISTLKSAVDKEGERHSDKLLPQNWRIASAILQEAAAVEPAYIIDSKMRARLEQAQRDELLTAAIHRADRAKVEGRMDQAKASLNALLAEHPDDARIRERLQNFDRPAAASKLAAVAPNENAKSPVAPIPANLGVESEDSPDDAADSFSKRWRAKIAITNSAWDSLKNFSALATSTAMLAAGGVLLWHHFARQSERASPALREAPRKSILAASPATPPPIPVAVTPVAVAPVAVSSDEQAWELVKGSDDAASLRSFLHTYPASTHALRARVRLAAVVWDKLDKTNPVLLDKYLRTYPTSPYRAEAERLKEAATPKSSPDSDLPPIR